MQLHLHPTRREALTASDTTITRWSLATTPATALVQLSIAPESVFHISYAASGQLLAFGGVTGIPDGILFAREQFNQSQYRYPEPCVIEWRSFEDLSLVRTSMVPHSYPVIMSLASSPDGRWLVIEGAEQIFLLNWNTGGLLSNHAIGDYCMSGLSIDPTSSFVAGVYSCDASGKLSVFRIDPAEQYVPRPQVEDWWSHEHILQDNVIGNTMLTLIHERLDRTDIAWPDGRDLADTVGTAAFSLDGRVVIFSLNSPYSGCGVELVAYEVASGKRLWCIHSEEENSGPFVLTPDGSMLLVPVQGGNLQMYRIEDGVLVQHLSMGLSEPIQALAFDHDGRTLWLATEERLVAYQPTS